ncbi:hypothetical protein B5X24_HaOG205225 [Helicoverpa armigera]|uniref:Uncharacterized protein n=1 Tax=Helicoverpa armigera TaxID=29058 RepID=A0A2W1BW96_HELAM|nr:hypothetical protein B5X24_HaOG205225 [Helicoverpa armigera]
MAQSLVTLTQDAGSNDNSMSTKEFLHFEKTCEAYKDSDEEIKMIFNEIKKLSAANKSEKVLSEDIDDVGLILKRAEEMAQETENLLKSSPVAAALNAGSPNKSESGAIPQIKVTKPHETDEDKDHKDNNTKVRCSFFLTYIVGFLMIGNQP